MRTTSRQGFGSWLRSLPVAGICAICAACSGSPGREDCLQGTEESGGVVYLVGHGWHAGLVVRRADIPPGAWPALADLPSGEFLEIGWGDRDFYRAPEPSWGTTLKAALWPTASVLHIVAFDADVPDYFTRSAIIAIPVSASGLARLSRHVGAGFASDTAGRTVSLGPGLYGRSRLYPSRETYHLFNTCNAWTARALQVAGCPIRPGSILSVDALLSRARLFGTPLRPMPQGDPPGVPDASAAP